MKRVQLLLFISAALLSGQDPAPAPETLIYSGIPLTVPYQCNEDVIQWAGLTCFDEPCPVYLELSRAAGLDKLVLAAGNFHAPNATLDSLVLRTEDGGKSWQEPHARIRGATLEGLQLFDAQTAWISGQLMQPISLDPFFLLTADGGKTWERVPLFDEEGTPGSIVQFVFDSREHGTAVVDRGGGDSRYELYESDNGGRTWSIRRKSSEIPKLKSAPDSAYRFRPEPKIFRLEKFEGTRWTPFLAFNVNAGSCHVKHEELAPPPSETAAPDQQESEPAAPPQPKPAPSLVKPHSKKNRQPK